MPTTVTVSTVAQLFAAIRTAGAGDAILLAPGNYGDLTMAKFNPAGLVTIKSADVNHQAVISGLTMQRSSNLSFQDIEFIHPLRAGEAQYHQTAIVANSTNISFVGVHFAGSMDGNFFNDGNGLLVSSSSRISILNSKFEQCKIAMKIVGVDDVVFAGNTIKDVREGVDIANVNGGLFEKNYVTNVVGDASKGDHADAFQLFAAGTGTTSSDVVFRSNVIITDSQGIFVQSAKTDRSAQHTNIVIENNYYQGNFRNAISVNETNNVIITGNTVRDGGRGAYAPAIVVGHSSNVQVDHNITPLTVQRTDSISPNVTWSNNIDVWDPQRKAGVPIASVFSTPLATGNIDFASLNATGSKAVDVTGIGFRAVAGIGHIAGTADAVLNSYVPQFEGHFSAHFFA